MSDGSEVPTVSGRLVLPLISHVVFFVAIAAGIDRGIVIPIYFLGTVGLFMALGLVEGLRVDRFLRKRYPTLYDEMEAQPGFRYSTFRGLRFSDDQRDGDPTMKWLQRRQQWAFMEGVTLPLVMVVVAMAGVIVSKQ